MEKIFISAVIVVFAIGGVLLIGLPVIAIVGWHYETGSGHQFGYVSAVERSGLIFKTGTAFIKPELGSTQEDMYCVVEESVADALRSAATSKQRVKVSHISWLAAGAKNCNAEGAVITKVEAI